MAFTTTMNLFGEERYLPAQPEYRRLAEEAAQLAVAGWLKGIDAAHTYLFEVNGIECALECFTGHWGSEARWRWGRTAAGDPDEDDSGENVLLEVALGCPLTSRKQGTRRRVTLVPPYGEGALSADEIRACATARAKENLGKLVLHRLG